MTNEDGHRALWGWLAETGDIKEKWPGWGTWPSQPWNCFACGEAGTYHHVDEDEDGMQEEYVAPCCSRCPIDWGVDESLYVDSETPCLEKGSPFYDWFEITDFRNDDDEMKRLAAIIRDLPWRIK